MRKSLLFAGIGLMTALVFNGCGATEEETQETTEREFELSSELIVSTGSYTDKIVVTSESTSTYNLYRSTSIDGTYELLQEGVAQNESYQDTEVTSGVTYYYVLSTKSPVASAALEDYAKPGFAGAIEYAGLQWIGGGSGNFSINDAIDYCASLGGRVPSIGEVNILYTNRDDLTYLVGGGMLSYYVGDDLSYAYNTAYGSIVLSSNGSLFEFGTVTTAYVNPDMNRKGFDAVCGVDVAECTATYYRCVK